MTDPRKVLYSEYVRNFKIAKDKILCGGGQILEPGIGLWQRKPERGSTWVFWGDVRGLCPGRGGDHCNLSGSQPRELHTQGQAGQEFPGGPVVKNVPAIW